MDTDRWDNEYLCRGRIWGGSAPVLPGLSPSSRVLELGCGDGKTVAMLVQSGCSVTAVDFSRNAARLCRHACTCPEQVRIIIADARRLPFRDESFDGIVASHIAGHLDQAGRKQLAHEIRRLLGSGGTMYFRDFSSGDFRCGKGTKTEAGTFLRRNGIATHYFTEDEVRVLFAGLANQSLVLHRWVMKVRGRPLPREEIVAAFRKNTPSPAVGATNPI